MKVNEIMRVKAVKYCGPEASLKEAAQKMKSGNCGALPVLDLKKRVVGIITDRDICLALTRTDTKPYSKIKVDDVMTRQVHTITMDDDLVAALHLMRENQVGRIPVIDHHGVLKGIISLHNLLYAQSNGRLNFNAADRRQESLAKTVRALSARYVHHDRLGSKEETMLPYHYVSAEEASSIIA